MMAEDDFVFHFSICLLEACSDPAVEAPVLVVRIISNHLGQLI